MTNTNEFLHATAHEGQHKYVYFLLGAAASAIAFAVHITRDQPLKLHHAVLGVAVALWALSFAFGIARERAALVAIRLNLEGNRRDVTPAHRAAANKRFDEAARRTARRFEWQTWSLLAGAIVFIVWHVIGMAQRANLL